MSSNDSGLREAAENGTNPSFLVTAGRQGVKLMGL